MKDRTRAIDSDERASHARFACSEILTFCARILTADARAGGGRGGGTGRDETETKPGLCLVSRNLMRTHGPRKHTPSHARAVRRAQWPRSGLLRNLGPV